MTQNGFGRFRWNHSIVKLAEVGRTKHSVVLNTWQMPQTVR